jgi:hypothetical protein
MKHEWNRGEIGPTVESIIRSYEDRLNLKRETVLTFVMLTMYGVRPSSSGLHGNGRRIARNSFL